MNLGGQSQNFPFSFFHSSADRPPATAGLPVSRGGLGGAKPPPDSPVHSLAVPSALPCRVDGEAHCLSQLTYSSFKSRFNFSLKT